MTNFETILMILVVIILIEVSYINFQYYKGNRHSKNQMIFVDTSSLIDGRILAVAKNGFFQGELVITRSVLAELQYIADNADSEKRTRARRGLDVVKELQDTDTVSVKIFQDGVRTKDGVDNQLISLAKKYNGSICTTDFNLNKVASVSDITVLNVNELAKELRMLYLPGDKLSLELTQKGSDSHQAIGHLPDGTMVVVERAVKLVGKKADIEVIRSLQTAAGRMLFAKLSDTEAVARTSKKAPVQRIASKIKPQPIKKMDKPVKPRYQKPTKASTKRQAVDREDSFINLVNKQD